jgi:class 3 adenylate cyclase
MADSRLPRLTRVSTTDGVRLPVERQGVGPRLVFVRGWITHIELQRHDPAVEPFFRALAEHREVVRYDTRGNGLADRVTPESIDLDALVHDLEAVMDALGTDEPVEMWGSCYVGPIAMAYVAKHPGRVSRLILDGTYARGADIAEESWSAGFLEMLELAKVQPDLVFSGLSYMTDPDPLGSHAVRVDRMKRAISPEVLVAFYRLAFAVDVSDLLAKVTVPTLVLHRRRSAPVPFRLGRLLAAELPDARFVELEGKAHNLWEEDPDSALDAIGQFLGIDELAATRRDAIPRSSTAESITVMFTDIAGSTELTGRLGDVGGQQLVRIHNQLVRDALRAHHGREVKHMGDGIMASFRSATAALDAASMIQRSVQAVRQNDEGATQLEIRIGLNAGEPIVEEDDLYGAVVQTAARTCAAAVPGQVLLTPVVRHLAAGKSFRFTDAGARQLKGIEPALNLWALEVEVVHP